MAKYDYYQEISKDVARSDALGGVVAVLTESSPTLGSLEGSRCCNLVPEELELARNNYGGCCCQTRDCCR